MDEKSKTIKLLPFEDLKKALNEKGIEYDERDISDAYYPLKDVEACFDTEMSAKMTAVPNHRFCPLCGKPSEELKWIYFDSPKWRWENLCGRCGPMSICPDCGCLVEFICILMN
jgi:hypothetical protein